MEEKKGRSKFGLGLLIGALAGVISGLIFAPKSGKQTRKTILKKIKELQRLLEEKEVDKKIKEIFGEASEEGKKIFNRVKEELITRLSQLKENIDQFDKNKYLAIINDVIKKVQKEFKKEVNTLDRLRNYLLEQWEKIHEKSDKKN